MAKVKYGLKNVHYAVWDPEKSQYKTPVKAPGAKKLTVEYDGDVTKFYADDVVYATFVDSSSISGELELADTEEQMLIDLLGYIDDSGLLLEDMDSTGVEFALMFEVNGDPYKRRCVYYSCKLSRPNTEANTKEDTTDPDTDTYSFSAAGKQLQVKGEAKNISKATVKSTDKVKYDSFFDSVLLPTASA